MTTAAAFLTEARKHLGYVEGHNNDTPFGKRLGANFQPWCDAFVSCVGADAGMRDSVGWFTYTPAHADWFRKRGRWGATPRVGAIVFFQWPGMGRIAHVGIVEKVNADGSIIAIEGNTDVRGGRTGGRVMRQARRTCIAGYGYPEFTAAPEPKPAPAKKAAAKRASLPTLRQGDVGEAVKQLQRLVGVTPDARGTFGPKTLAAVLHAQKKHGLKVTGVCDAALWKALGR